MVHKGSAVHLWTQVTRICHLKGTTQWKRVPHIYWWCYNQHSNIVLCPLSLSHLTGRKANKQCNANLGVPKLNFISPCYLCPWIKRGHNFSPRVTPPSILAMFFSSGHAFSQSQHWCSIFYSWYLLTCLSTFVTFLLIMLLNFLRGQLWSTHKRFY